MDRFEAMTMLLTVVEKTDGQSPAIDLTTRFTTYRILSLR